MITLILERGLFCPVVLCDYCGERIKATEGNVEWMPGDDGLPVDGALYFLHQTCYRAFWAKRGGWVGCLSLPLPSVLSNLLHNVGFTKEVAARAARQARLFSL